MPEVEKKSAEAAAGVRGLLRKPDWYAEMSFSRARILLGAHDYVDIVLLPGALADRVMALVSGLGGALKGLASSTDVEAGLAIMLQAVEGETRQKLWDLVADGLACCVAKADLTEIEKDLPKIVMPTAQMSAAERVKAAQALPLRLTARIVVGIAVQAGNL